jgi:hypothetical protein
VAVSKPNGMEPDLASKFSVKNAENENCEKRLLALSCHVSLSVRPSEWNLMDFHEILHLNFSQKSVEKIRFS